MQITNTARMVNGKLVYDRPKTAEERERDYQRFNEMCKARQAPGAMGTDRAFLEGHHNHGFATVGKDKDPEFMQEMMVRKAKEAGVVVQGKKYVGGLADNRGVRDPRAWVSDTHEVLAVAKERNLDIRGVINHEGHRVEAPPDVPLCEKMVNGIIKDYESANPKLKEKRREEMVEMVVHEHGKPAHERGKRRRKQLA